MIVYITTDRTYYDRNLYDDRNLRDRNLYDRYQYDGIMIITQDNTNQILYLPVDDDEYEPFSP